MYPGISDAITLGSVERLRDLVNSGAIIEIHAIRFAIMLNKLEIVKYMFETGHIVSSIATHDAAEFGRLEILKYLVSVDADIDEDAIELADRNEEYDTLRYLLMIDAPRLYSDRYNLILVSYYRVVLTLLNEFILTDISGIINNYLQKKILP